MPHLSAPLLAPCGCRKRSRPPIGALEVSLGGDYTSWVQGNETGSFGSELNTRTADGWPLQGR